MSLFTLAHDTVGSTLVPAGAPLVYSTRLFDPSGLDMVEVCAIVDGALVAISVVTPEHLPSEVSYLTGVSILEADYACIA